MLHTLDMETKMTKEQAMKELVKVAVGFKMLQSGRLSLMSADEFGEFKKWLA